MRGKLVKLIFKEKAFFVVSVYEEKGLLKRKKWDFPIIKVIFIDVCFKKCLKKIIVSNIKKNHNKLKLKLMWEMWGSYNS